MKGHKTLAAIAAVFAVAMFISCNNLTLNGVNTGSASDRNVQQMATLSAEIVNYADFNKIPQSNGARTILPGVYDYSDYDYYLYGITTTGKSIGSTTAKEIAIDVVDEKGTFECPIDPGIWTFILYALKSGATPLTNVTESDIQDNAVLWAHAHSDMERSAGTVKFKLTPDGLKGKGTIRFNLYTRNKPNDTSTTSKWIIPDGTVVKAEIKNRISGEVVVPAKIISKPVGSTTTTEFVPVNEGVAGTGSDTALYSEASIDPGTYSFVVTFSVDRGALYGVQDYVYTETLVVVSGRESNTPVNIPNIIGELPAAPTNFEAFYVLKSEDNAAHEGYYSVVFQWKDNSNSEKYFELWLADITGRTSAGKLISNNLAPGSDPWCLQLASTHATPINDLIAFADMDKEGVSTPVGATVTYNQTDGYSTVQRWGGSVLANNKEYGVYLPLGRSYQARIRAVNDVGASDWQDCVLPDTPTATTTELVDDIAKLIPFKEGSVAGPFINRFRLVYDVQDGYYPKDLPEGTKTEAEVNENLVKYYVYTEASGAAKPIALWSAEETGTGYVLLKQGDDTSDPTASPPILDEREPFRFWVLDISKFNTGVTDEDKTKVYDAGAAAGAKMLALDAENFTTSGYAGQENKDLYAVYNGSFKGEVEIDHIEKYVLEPGWISYTSNGTTTGPTTSKTALEYAFTVNRDDVIDTANDGDQTLTFSLTIPNNTPPAEPAIPAMYDTVSIKVNKSNGRSAVPKKVQNNISGTAFGTPIEIGDIDISSLSSGTYTVIVECVKYNNGNPRIASITMVMTIDN